jgi:hypothetical protein
VRELTIRGFGEELGERLRTLARERGISLNKAALLLLRRGAGLGAEGPPPNVVGDALDELIGSWTPEEERSLLDSIDVLEQVDESLWK